jgi:hypothetical protein
MKRIVRLTESDMVRLVNKVIKEQNISSDAFNTIVLPDLQGRGWKLSKVKGGKDKMYSDGYSLTTNKSGIWGLNDIVVQYTPNKNYKVWVEKDTQGGWNPTWKVFELSGQNPSKVAKDVLNYVSILLR